MKCAIMPLSQIQKRKRKWKISFILDRFMPTRQCLSLIQVNHIRFMTRLNEQEFGCSFELDHRKMKFFFSSAACFCRPRAVQFFVVFARQHFFLLNFLAAEEHLASALLSQHRVVFRVHGLP